jgi:hypothetical protein
VDKPKLEKKIVNSLKMRDLEGGFSVGIGEGIRWGV